MAQDHNAGRLLIMVYVPALSFGKCFTPKKLGMHLSDIQNNHVTTIPDFLKDEPRQQMLTALETLAWKQAAHETGKHRIKQDYEYIGNLSGIPIFAKVAEELTRILTHNASPTYIPEVFTLNDLTVQRYRKTEQGISPHRDSSHFRGVIALLVLEGEGEFFLCDDREGNNPRAIENRAGDLLLLRAPSFAGSDVQPYHYVGKVLQSRTSFALRYDSRKK